MKYIVKYTTDNYYYYYKTEEERSKVVIKTFESSRSWESYGFRQGLKEAGAIVIAYYDSKTAKAMGYK